MFSYFCFFFFVFRLQHGYSQVTTVAEKEVKFDLNENPVSVSLLKFDSSNVASFSASSIRCQDRNQELAFFDTQDDYNQLVNLVAENVGSFSTNNIIYLGGTHELGTDLNVEVPPVQVTDFIFLNGEEEGLPVLHDINNWQSNQPDNFDDSQRCLCLFGNSPGLADFFCDAALITNFEELSGQSFTLGFICIGEGLDDDETEDDNTDDEEDEFHEGDSDENDFEEIFAIYIIIGILGVVVLPIVLMTVFKIIKEKQRQREQVRSILVSSYVSKECL